MNPLAFLVILLVIVLAGIASLGLIIGACYWGIVRNAGVRSREYDAMREERNTAWRALADVEDQVLPYSDIDSLLASTIRPIIRTHTEQKMGIKR